MKPEEPFDLTRPNEYQGRWNRAGLVGNIAFGVFAILLGVGSAAMGALADAPWWWWGFALFFVLLGSVTIAYWYRAFRRSRPPS